MTEHSSRDCWAEVESFGRRTPASLIRRAAYDPDRTKILV